MDVSWITIIVGLITTISTAAVSLYMAGARKKGVMEENDRLRAEVEALKARTAIAVRDSDISVLRKIIDDVSERNSGILQRVEKLEDEIEEQIGVNNALRRQIGDLTARYEGEIRDLKHRIETLEDELKARDDEIKRLKANQGGL